MCINNIIIDIDELNRFIIIGIKIKLLSLNLTKVSKTISFSYVYADFFYQWEIIFAFGVL